MEAKLLIQKAYEKALEKGYNQTRWSSDSGYAINGQTVSRMLKKGDCRLSTITALLETLEMELKITDKEKK